MEVDVTKILIGIAALVIGGGAGGLGTNRVNETSNAEERQQMREIHHEELAACNEASEKRLEGARRISLEHLTQQRETCDKFVERCVALVTGKQ